MHPTFIFFWSLKNIYKILFSSLTKSCFWSLLRRIFTFLEASPLALHFLLLIQKSATFAQNLNACIFPLSFVIIWQRKVFILKENVFFSFLLFRILLPRDNILNNKVFTKIFTKNLTYYLTNKKTLAKW